MSLRLTVLGGAAAWPNPGQGCSSYLIRDGSRSLVLDCGSGTLIELRKHVDYTDVDAIFISHCHADHILDLVPYRYGLVYGHKRPSDRIPVWLPPGGRQTMEGLADTFGALSERVDDFWSSVFTLSRYDPSSPTNVNGLTVSFCPTQHFVPCYAMRVTNGAGESIVYASDTGTVDQLVDFAAGANVLIAEATLEDDDDSRPETRGHLTPTLAGRFAADAGVGTLVLTHLWSERSSADVVRAAAAEFHGRIEVATPGLNIDAS